MSAGLCSFWRLQGRLHFLASFEFLESTAAKGQWASWHHSDLCFHLQISSPDSDPLSSLFKDLRIPWVPLDKPARSPPLKILPTLNPSSKVPLAVSGNVFIGSGDMGVFRGPLFYLLQGVRVAIPLRRKCSLTCPLWQDRRFLEVPSGGFWWVLYISAFLCLYSCFFH